MTASFMRLPFASAVEIGEQIHHRLANLLRLALEEVIRVLDDGQLLRLGDLRIEAADVAQRNQLVTIAVDEELGKAGFLDRAEVELVHGQADAEEQLDARIVQPDVPRDPRAEREARTRKAADRNTAPDMKSSAAR